MVFRSPISPSSMSRPYIYVRSGENLRVPSFSVSSSTQSTTAGAGQPKSSRVWIRACGSVLLLLEPEGVVAFLGLRAKWRVLMGLVGSGVNLNLITVPPGFRCAAGGWRIVIGGVGGFLLLDPASALRGRRVVVSCRLLSSSSGSQAVGS